MSKATTEKPLDARIAEAEAAAAELPTLRERQRLEAGRIEQEQAEKRREAALPAMRAAARRAADAEREELAAMVELDGLLAASPLGRAIAARREGYESGRAFVIALAERVPGMNSLRYRASDEIRAELDRAIADAGDADAARRALVSSQGEDHPAGLPHGGQRDPSLQFGALIESLVGLVIPQPVTIGAVRTPESLPHGVR